MTRFTGRNLGKFCAIRCYSKEVKFGAEVRAAMIKGIDLLADAVGVTMGPKGHSVILEQGWASPRIAKDGVTVAKSISLKDKYQNLGAKLVQDVANNINEKVGDGTTTATIMARAITKEGFSHISHGANPIEIRRGVMKAVESVKDTLKCMSRQVTNAEEITHIATISANGETKIGNLICDVISKVGREGIITVKQGRTLKDTIEIIDGIKFNKGYISPFFINSLIGSKVVFNNALVLISLKKITKVSQILTALELAYSRRKALVIIADDIAGEALGTLVVNKLKLGLQIAAVNAPSFGDYRKAILADIAIKTGAVIFGDDTNFCKIEKIRLEDFGEVGEVVMTKNSTLLMKGKAEKQELDFHVEQLKAELVECDNGAEKIRLNERLSRLSSSIAVLHIGGSSEVEVKEKKDRVTDALNATRAAVFEGIVAGGGIAFLRCIPKLMELKTENGDQTLGVDVIKKALCTPCLTIANNAGIDGAAVVAKVMNGSGDYGYDALKNEYGNLIAKGIIDPTKVVCTAISDAAGVASLLSTTEVVITNIRCSNLLSKLTGNGKMDNGINGINGMGNFGGMGDICLDAQVF